MSSDGVAPEPDEIGGRVDLAGGEDDGDLAGVPLERRRSSGGMGIKITNISSMALDICTLDVFSQILKQFIYFVLNMTPKEQPSLLIVVESSLANFVQRDVVRKSWARPSMVPASRAKVTYK